MTLVHHKNTPTVGVGREEERGNVTKHSDEEVQRFIDHKSHFDLTFPAFTVVTILVKKVSCTKEETYNYIHIRREEKYISLGSI